MIFLYNIQCFYRGGQYRRCLAILEQKGYLSATVVVDLGRWLLINSVQTSSEELDNFKERICGIELAAQCLYSLEQYEDCVSLLQPLVPLDLGDNIVERLETMFHKSSNRTDVNPLSCMYCILGKCYDMLDHRSRALRALTVALRLDLSCIEAAEYIADSCMLTAAAKNTLFQSLCAASDSCWLLEFYRVILLGRDPSKDPTESKVVAAEGSPLISTIDGHSHHPTDSAAWIARRAEFSFGRLDVGEAYRLARLAYSQDPYDNRALYVYVAAMVELKLKTELFYLGHELVNSFPKKAMSWYAVGCYYWCCGKLDLAQKHLVKATKMDKRLSRAWILLGHVMSGLEESEQAISAFRTASRLLPGEHLPLVCMAKELARSNHLASALHILLGALEICPQDPGLLNELGVTYLRHGSMDLALQYFDKAVHAIDVNTNRSSVQYSSLQGQDVVVPGIAYTVRGGSGSEVRHLSND